MDDYAETVKVKLPNGAEIQVEAVALGGERDVSVGIPSFDAVTDAIEGIAQSVRKSFETIQPRKATVELGLELATESGQLTALLVKGSGKASLKITLEWAKEDKKE